ncbi:MAG: hypothetical protein WHU95_07125 [candidate division WOR-3 bacterium]|jgi:hypothetical protein|nr:hypothetical protein [candidate division WOR-3 bacterium]MDH7519446.1 hypothetical protein [bacterium]
MEITGYSERGMINSLFYEINYLPGNQALLNEFISLVSFPYRDVHFKLKNDVKILIEQSFSDFGVADAVLLINNDGHKQSVFIEAKVKTSHRKFRSLDKEFNDFKHGLKDEVDSSNLFTQLYHKTRLFKKLQSGGTAALEELKEKGIPFPQCSTKKIRKIGKNGVVLRAVNIILGEYLDDAFFVALVPVDPSDAKRFYEMDFKNYNPPDFQDWSIKNWGYLTWKDVEDFCRKNDLKATQRNFQFNQGQIF